MVEQRAQRAAVETAHRAGGPRAARRVRRPGCPRRPCGRRRRPAGGGGRDRRARGGVGVRQDHAGARPAGPRAALGRRGAARRDPARPLRAWVAGVPAQGPARPPGPRRGPEPAAHRLRVGRGGGPAAPARRARRPRSHRGRPGRRGALVGGPAAAGAAVPALPARAVGRPAPARPHRRCPGDGPPAAGRRRARVVARRLDPRRDPRADPHVARAARPRRPGRHPRPRAWRGTSPTGSR